MGEGKEKKLYFQLEKCVVRDRRNYEISRDAPIRLEDGRMYQASQVTDGLVCEVYASFDNHLMWHRGIVLRPTKVVLEIAIQSLVDGHTLMDFARKALEQRHANDESEELVASFEWIRFQKGEDSA